MCTCGPDCGGTSDGGDVVVAAADVVVVVVVVAVWGCAYIVLVHREQRALTSCPNLCFLV